MITTPIVFTPSQVNRLNIFDVNRGIKIASRTPTNVEAEAPIASIANPERTEILPSTAKAIEAGLLLG